LKAVEIGIEETLDKEGNARDPEGVMKFEGLFFPRRAENTSRKNENGRHEKSKKP